MVGCARESSNGDADALPRNTSTGSSDGAAAVGSISSSESDGASPRPTPVPVGPRPTAGPDAGPFYDCGPRSGLAPPLRPRHFIDWTPDGSAIMFDDGTAVMMVGADGSRLRAIVDANPGFAFRHGFHADVSPDGSGIVYSSCQFPTDGLYLTYQQADRSWGRYLLDGRSRYIYEIASVAIDGSEWRRLTTNGYLDHFPSWSPDGSLVAFIKGRSSTFYNADFSPARNSSEETARNEVDLADWTLDLGLDFPVTHAWSPAWSPDGEQLAIVANVGRAGEIYSVRTDGVRIQKSVGHGGCAFLVAGRQPPGIGEV